MILTSMTALGSLAAYVGGHWCVKRNWQVVAGPLATTALLLAVSPLSAALLTVITVATYGLAQPGRGRTARGLYTVAALAGLFLGLKLTLLSDSGFVPTELVLLGFSYYVLRAVHYVVEGMKGTLPAHGWWDYANYMAFLPTLLVGPIHRFPDFHRELYRRRWDPALFSLGLERIVYGYVKVVVLANYLIGERFTRYLASESLPAAVAAYLDCLRYGLNLYFQFSGYSDVALGLAMLLGIRLQENFRHPFLKSNISAFWRAWHISLSTWCRDYVYMPIVAVTRWPVLGVMGAMVAVGVWHELSWRYLAWGLYHGAGILVWQGFHKLKLNAGGRWRWGAWLVGWLLTFNFVVLSFAITKEASLTDAWAVYLTILTGAKP